MTTSKKTSMDRADSAPTHRSRRWIWLLGLGICLLAQGGISVVNAAAVAIMSMRLAGWLLIATGVFAALVAIRHRANRHLYRYLVGAVLAFVVGVVLLRNPAEVAREFPVLVALYFIVLGAFNVVTAFRLRDPQWGWMLCAGIAGLILGILTWTEWPVSGAWALGLFIGVNFIVIGASQIVMALALRRHENLVAPPA